MANRRKIERELNFQLAYKLCARKKRIRSIQMRLMSIFSVSTFAATLIALFINTSDGKVAEKPVTVTWAEAPETSGKDCMAASAKPAECVEFEISELDKNNFKAAEKLVTAKEFDKAKDIADSIDNEALKETAQAAMLISPEYKATSTEYRRWLSDNQGHPLQKQIEARFKRDFAKEYKKAEAEKTREKLEYTEKAKAEVASEIRQSMNLSSNEPASSGKSKQSKNNAPVNASLKSGLSLWAKKDYSAAAAAFAGTYKKVSSKKEKAEAAFWAYRAHLRNANFEEADHFLQIARKQKPSFYSMLAEQINAQDKSIPDADSAKVKTNPEYYAGFLETDTAKRIVALHAVGHDGLAKRELEREVATLSQQHKFAVSKLAYELGINIGGGVKSGIKTWEAKSGVSADEFPIPGWEPDGGFKIDPALVYAIIKKESRFSSAAISPMGAVGVMQILPKTAAAISDSDASSVHELLKNPNQNIVIGQKYLQQLMAKRNISNNLFYLLTAYNAGPGNLVKWRNDIKCGNDPLLFLEMIPAKETREYVEEVMAAYWVYKGLLGKKDASLTQLASGSWPRHSYKPI